MSDDVSFFKIKGFNNYEISKSGKIRNLKNGRILKPCVDKDGYLVHCLSEKGKSKTVFLHRIIAITFIDNPENKPCINHIDENKLNNDINNLEWCTVKENITHGTRTKRASEKCWKSVIKLDLDNNFLEVFKSMTEASLKTGVLLSSISNCCNGRIKSAGGYKWRIK